MIPTKRHSKWRIIGLIIGPMIMPVMVLFAVLYFHTEVQGDFLAEGGAHPGFRLRLTKCRGIGSDNSEPEVKLSSSDLPGVSIDITPRKATVWVPAHVLELSKEPGRSDDCRCRLFEAPLVQERTIFYPLIHSAFIESPVDLLFKTRGRVAIDCDTKLLGRIHGSAVFRQCN